MKMKAFDFLAGRLQVHPSHFGETVHGYAVSVAREMVEEFGAVATADAARRLSRIEGHDGARICNIIVNVCQNAG